MKEALTKRGLALNQARMTVHDRGEWRGLVYKGMKLWVNRWHRTEIQTHAYGVICGGMLLGGQGTTIY